MGKELDRMPKEPVVVQFELAFNLCACLQEVKKIKM
jgi:hypothetical protein